MYYDDNTLMSTVPKNMFYHFLIELQNKVVSKRLDVVLLSHGASDNWQPDSIRGTTPPQVASLDLQTSA
jgi:hypothetical protein